MSARRSISASMVDKAAQIPRFAARIAGLDPAHLETILVDSESTTGSLLDRLGRHRVYDSA